MRVITCRIESSIIIIDSNRGFDSKTPDSYIMILAEVFTNHILGETHFKNHIWGEQNTRLWS